MEDQSSDVGTLLKEAHKDLSRKYRRHAAAIETAWQSFNQAQRVQCVKAGAADGVVLKNPTDGSLGNVYKILPEWNLRDITEPGSDYLLDLLKYRATTSLFNTYRAGPDGAFKGGDRGVIEESMAKRNLRHVNPFEDCYTLFMGSDIPPYDREDHEEYGRSYHIPKQHKEALEGFRPAIQAGLCLPQSTGDFILQRQLCLHQSLAIIIDDILEMGSKTRAAKEGQKKRQAPHGKEAASTALEKLSLQATDVQPATTSDILAAAEERRDAHQEYTNLLATEPIVLAHAINIFFFTRPEIVPDEKGRQLSAFGDKFISPAFFDTIHGAVRATTIWTYLSRLLKILEPMTAAKDKPLRNIVLQEIANICSLEFSRCRELFKRQIQTRPGTSYFKRISNSVDKDGSAKVTLKKRPEEQRLDTQLYWTLRLCESDTDPKKAREYLEQLSTFQHSYPEKKESWEVREAEALFELAVITTFIQDLSSAVKLPSVSRKGGQALLARIEQTNTRMSNLKEGVDLRDFAAPIDHLLEPGMAEEALSALDVFLRESTGSSMGATYQAIFEESVTDVTRQMEAEKAKASKGPQASQPAPNLMSTTEAKEATVHEHQPKQKTRPPHSSAFALTLPEEQIAESPTDDKSPSQHTYSVSPATHAVFSTLFARSNEARGSVNWSAFQSSMAELGFSVIPKVGSVYTFRPPSDMGTERGLTLHRPHHSRIEGYLTLIFARRLRRAYGWNENSFELSTE